MKNFYSQDKWDEGYQNREFSLPSSRDQMRRWLEIHARGRTGRCLEIGCFPGGYLATLGELGFEVNGLDLTARMNEAESWLRSQKYRVGELKKGDFFETDFKPEYDLVYSIGFIEHFDDWKSVVTKHADAVKPGGLLMLSTPNFSRGFQKLFHQLFDRENVSRHNLDAMDPAEWKGHVEKLGFRVKECGYFDELDFWIGVEDRSLLEKSAFRVLRAAKPLLRAVAPRKDPAFAPYAVLVAEKI